MMATSLYLLLFVSNIDLLPAGTRGWAEWHLSYLLFISFNTHNNYEENGEKTKMKSPKET